MVFFAQKHLILVKKIGYGFGGYPPPPLYGQNFKQKGGYGFGGYPPPPLRTKSAKQYLMGSLSYNQKFNKKTKKFLQKGLKMMFLLKNT